MDPSTWIAVAPVFVATMGVLLVPGVCLLFTLGARGWTLAGLAAPVSYSMIGIAAILLQSVGIGFNPLSLVAVCLVFIALAIAVRYITVRAGVQLFGVQTHDSPSDSSQNMRFAFASIIAIAVPMLLIGYRYIGGIVEPTRISQLFDNIFHLNAVKFISESERGSSLTLGSLTENSQGFYPAAMHDLLAQVSMLGNFSIPVVMNVGAIFTASVVWPLSCVYLATRIFGKNAIAVVASGILSVAFAEFPYRLVSFGVLYPLHAAFAMAPVLLGLFIQASRQRTQLNQGILSAACGLLLALPGVALTHPSAIVAALLFALPYVIFGAAKRLRDSHSTSMASRLVPITAGLLYVAITAVIFLKARPALDSAPWVAQESTAQSIGAVISGGSLGFESSLFIAVAVITSVTLSILVPKNLPILFSFLIAAGIYVVGASSTDESWRELVTGVWYKDNYRLAALLPMVTIPLIASGFVTIASFTSRLAARWNGRNELLSRFNGGGSKSTPIWISAAGLAIVAAVLAPLTQSAAIRQAQLWMNSTVGTGEDAALVSQDEQELIKKVASFVPKDGVVVGDPITGASLVYTLGDRKALAPHVFGKRTTEERLLLRNWDEAGTNPEVCPAVRDLNAYWALDFGTQGALGGVNELPGLDRIIGEANVPKGYRVLDQVGSARLIEVTLCGTPPQ